MEQKPHQNPNSLKIVGCMPARNEAWVITLSARVALSWCDSLVILDHASTDGTIDIVQAIGAETNRTILMADSRPGWDEMRHRQAMLEVARADGATHIAIIDADEILTANLLPRIRSMVECLPRSYCLQLPGYNLRHGLDSYHSSGIWGNRWFSVAFVDDPRLSWSGDTFHAREPQGVRLNACMPVPQGQGGVLHLWGASERRLKAKHALYKLAERIRWPNKSIAEIDAMYSWAIHGRLAIPADTPKHWRYASVPEAWWAGYDRSLLDVDAEPWQEQECRRIIAEHPGIEKGLDLFGVVG